MRALLLCQDLFFGSQIRAAATAAGCELEECSSASQLIKSAAISQLAIIDLTCKEAGHGLPQLVRDLRAVSGKIQLVAYGPHVQHRLLENAAQADFDRVLTRGQFHRELDALFAGGGEDPTGNVTR